MELALKPKYFVLVCGLAASVSSAQIRRVTAFREDGRNPSWSRDGQVLFERAGKIVLAGANAAEDLVVVAGGGPEWSPLARYFAFATGGRIVLMAPDARTALDSFPAGDARDLRFSRDGRSLAWMDSGVARIRTGGVVTTLALPEGLKLAGVDDFTVSGGELLVTASHDGIHTEIYACGIARPGCLALTDKPTQRQDFARLSPSGGRIVFASSETAWVPDAPIDYEADVWLQSIGDQGKALRMTWFNEPANPRYDPERARVNAGCWSRDGRWFLATITEGPRQDRSRLVKIEFPEAE